MSDLNLDYSEDFLDGEIQGVYDLFKRIENDTNYELSELNIEMRSVIAFLDLGIACYVLLMLLLQHLDNPNIFRDPSVFNFFSHKLDFPYQLMDFLYENGSFQLFLTIIFGVFCLYSIYEYLERHGRKNELLNMLETYRKSFEEITRNIEDERSNSEQ